MKSLLLGILVIVLAGIGGLVYRNILERPVRPVTCPLDALACPDGTSVARTGSSCSFPACPPPNVTLQIGLAFAVPAGFTDASLPDAESVAAYESADAGIIIRRYPIAASSTALATMQKTAVSASGKPVSATSFSSTELGTHRFTVVSIERRDGVIDTAYYLARGNDVLRFDAIDREVANWSEANINLSVLPAHAALIKLLTTLQGRGLSSILTISAHNISFYEQFFFGDF